MTIEIWRFGLTAFSATLAPFAVAELRARRLSRAGIALVVALLGLAPALDTAGGWLFVLGLGGVQLWLGPGALPLPRRPGARGDVLIWAAGRWRELAVATALAAGSGAALLARPGLPGRAWDELTAPSSSVMLIGVAVLAATLAWGVVVEAAIAIFSARLETMEEGLPADGVRHAGRVIGWLERTLIVAGLAAGRPELLAVVVAVKSVARLPEFKNETFAEYFLIGSLLSLTGAVLAGGLVRLLVFGELP